MEVQGEFQREGRHLSRFSIFITQPRGWSHLKAFAEIAEGLAWSLGELGHDVAAPSFNDLVVVNPSPPLGRSIILAPTFLVDAPLAPDAILYNFEQVPGDLGSPGTVASMVSDAWLRGDFLKLYRRHTVWDYSATNVDRLRRLGVADVHHCRVGYAPCLTRINSVPVEDIDVLFYGTLQEGSRRYALLQEMTRRTVRQADGTERPMRVVALQGVYGADRDGVIARSKIVLNVHCNEPAVAPAIFAIARCSWLLANTKCVVSEAGGQDPELDALAREACVSVPYDRIADTCVALVDESVAGSAAMRREIAETGFRVFSKVSQVDEVRRALAESTVGRST